MVTMDTNNNATSTNLTGLSIYTTYTIFVRAKTIVLGSNSSSVVVSTDEDSELFLITVVFLLTIYLNKLAKLLYIYSTVKKMAMLHVCKMLGIKSIHYEFFFFS